MKYRLPNNLLSYALIAVSTVLLSACGRESVSDTNNVFGPDNRVPTKDESPYRAIGRLDSGCTGTLVGRNLVLTAAHCVIDPATGTVKPEVKFFRPDLRDGKSAKPTWVNFLWIGSKDPVNDRLNDWAFLRLDANIGDEFGTLPLLSVDVSTQLPYTVSEVGYSTDKTNGDTQNIHKGCYIHKVVESRLYNDCDSTEGISGAPLLTTVNGNQYIIAIAVSEFRQGARESVTREQYSEDYTNVAIPTSTFFQTATTLIGSVDGGTSLPHFDGLIELVNPNSRDQTGGPTTASKPDQNPGDRKPDGSRPGDSQPRVGDSGLATPFVLSQRGSTIKGKVNQLAGTVRFMRDVSQRSGYRDVLVQTPRILGDVQTFDRIMGQVINGAYGTAAYADPLSRIYSTLVSDAEYYQHLDSRQIPGPLVGNFEQARRDLQDLIVCLGTLIQP